MLLNWQRDFALCLRDPDAMPAALPAGEERFGIYRDNMAASLIAALREAFPVTRMLVGERFFAAVALDYVRQEPPAAPRLSAYGSSYPAYLRALPDLRDLAYVADIARLEWARVEAYFTGPADRQVEPDALLQYPLETLPLLQLCPTPSLRVIRAETAIWSIWTVHQAASPDVAGIDPEEPQAVRLSCSSDGVMMSPIPAAHAVFLQALIDGRSILSAAEKASIADEDFALQPVLVDELRLGSFTEILTPEGHD